MSSRILSAWAVAVCVLLGGCRGGTEQTALAAQPNEPAADAAAEKSVTVFPIQITPSEGPGAEFQERLGVVVGVFLEKAGVEQVEASGRTFTPPAAENLEGIAKAFAAHAAAGPLDTGHALYGEILHTDRKVRAIRTILVDKQGGVVLAAEDTPETFARVSDTPPKDPMSCCVFVARKVQKHWGLADPLRPDAPQGKLVERLKREAGAPSDEELAAARRRQEAMRAELAKVKLTVYPVRIGTAVDKECAAEIARMINEQGLCTCQAAEDGPALNVQGHFDQQKVLWDTARAFRNYLRNNPPATEYAMYADFGMSAGPPGQAEVQGVHWILCNRAGDWVVVDYQNSHHADFQRIGPKSREDCTRLVVRRLETRLADNY